jgi:hypothetical protein
MSVTTTITPELRPPMIAQVRTTVFVWVGRFSFTAFVVLTLLLAIARAAGATPVDSI